MEEWNEDLAKDIHDALKYREKHLAKIHGNSQFLYWRRYLVDWLALTCQKFHLNSNAQHLAVCLYDRFTDRYTPRVHDLRLLVICCLLVASKFEEREEKIPKFKILMEHLQWQLKASDYLQLELKILSSFSWNIGFPTASHFKDYYMKVAITDNDLYAGMELVNKEEALVYVEKNVNYFLEVSLQDAAFLNFKPSLIMASCVASARICVGITPTWNVRLHKQTHFGWSQIQPCIEILLSAYPRFMPDCLRAKFHLVIAVGFVVTAKGEFPVLLTAKLGTGNPLGHPYDTVYKWHSRNILHDEDRKAMQESANNLHHQRSNGMSLNSTGNTPVTSPIPAIEGYSYHSAMAV